MSFVFADLFAGIGGFRIALESIGGECIFSSEWDKYAQMTYKANFGDIPNGDITKIEPSAIPDKIVAKNSLVLKELIGYLEKHQSEIIDYDRRRRVGKCIGSGRMEKGVDLVVGHRQKKKGLSWSSNGSKALSLLKIAELNGHWNHLCFPSQPV
ncbi:DNA cytosine methyltransferase [Pseudanabaena sp. FACHB-1277]|uniref:DNA cytosine methyltransferase n=1 Tax=Pseudanabaena cinerea FACHB-1277 TaxID=2949581 RepID=A0A926UX85_9CYAN|nr:DNA cytosine methyltransferase [Pseudanabaena cinerea]MBD2152578.1 DNA cytosine methyltransferase [Pseudanabaena cinerea FACHB-1277]